MFETLLTKLQTDKYITLETTPSHSSSIMNILDDIENNNLSKKVDGFSTTDNPLAKLKYNSLFAAIKIQNKCQKPVIATMSMRDRNKISLQSDLLGVNDFDIRAILALTGDPASMSDQPHTKGVFESNSNLLLEIIYSFNNGMDYAGKPFKIAPKTIYPFSVINSFAKNMKSLEKKMFKKVQNGTKGIITQPIYDIENAKKLIEYFNNVQNNFIDDRNKSQLIIGMFPITRLRTAQFLHSHVPGIYVPQNWLDKLTIASKISIEEEKKVGMRLSIELFLSLKKIHPKIHIMTANKFDLASELLD
ncbi:MAG: methylenetetrahydrofolate reductase [Campylobacterota bacterium]|nr:methylenetetrahydrofolate reductase [Campylobacterota bacterium]